MQVFPPRQLLLLVHCPTMAWPVPSLIFPIELASPWQDEPGQSVLLIQARPARCPAAQVGEHDAPIGRPTSGGVMVAQSVLVPVTYHCPPAVDDVSRNSQVWLEGSLKKAVVPEVVV